ncbi:MAG: hypothetical protein FWC11_03800 [Firmicutes bacterium]|nr:hypothetical protein [Bacillota bacterium]
MKQLSNFNKSNFSEEKLKKIAGDVGDAEERVQEAFEKYSKLDEDGLINELVKKVRTQRAEGTYDGEQMKSSVEFLRPHLSQTQYEKLHNLITLLNSEDI